MYTFKTYFKLADFPRLNQFLERDGETEEKRGVKVNLALDHRIAKESNGLGACCWKLKLQAENG
jgi:hypothetical protein